MRLEESFKNSRRKFVSEYKKNSERHKKLLSSIRDRY